MEGPSYHNLVANARPYERKLSAVRVSSANTSLLLVVVVDVGTPDTDRENQQPQRYPEDPLDCCPPPADEDPVFPAVGESRWSRLVVTLDKDRVIVDLVGHYSHAFWVRTDYRLTAGGNPPACYN